MNCSWKQTRTLFEKFGVIVTELSTTISIARIKKMSRKRWGAGISRKRLRSGGLRLVELAEIRRKTAGKDAGVPGSL
jgi:hypothetical protein